MGFFSLLYSKFSVIILQLYNKVFNSRNNAMNIPKNMRNDKNITPTIIVASKSSIFWT